MKINEIDVIKYFRHIFNHRPNTANIHLNWAVSKVKLTVAVLVNQMNTENRDKSRGKWKTIDTVAIIGSAASVLGFVFPFIPSSSYFWSMPLLLVIFILCSGFLLRKWLMTNFDALHTLLKNASPWLITTVLVLSCLILYRVTPQNVPRKVLFDNGRGAIFNSSDHASQTTHLQAWGAKKGDFQWVISDAGQTGQFSYGIDASQAPSAGASSGAYLTFYDSHIDRLQYRSLVFRCRATDYHGAADIGVRLVVDDPQKQGDRELVAYQLGSVASISPIDEKWRTYELPIGDLRQERMQPPFPNGLDANTINKIVFFVDNRIGSNSPAATIWIGDISFMK